jgi:hypothetical protein
MLVIQSLLIIRRHQLTALAMMVEKECGISENPLFPAIWELSHTGEATKKSVIDNAIETNQRSLTRTTIDTATGLPARVSKLPDLCEAECLLM